MALRPGNYPAPKLPEPRYVDERAKDFAEQLERDWKARTKDIPAQPVKRQALV